MTGIPVQGLSPAKAGTGVTRSIVVHQVRVADEGRWQWRGSRLTWQPPHRYGFEAEFDPFPAYPHDPDAARKAADHVAACCPPLWDVNLYLADREETSRSNGHSNVHEGGRYEGSEWVQDEPSGMILLSAKRIPPHPAMTRHLVAHEYGHNVEYMLNSLRGGRHVASCDDLEREYAEMRGLPPSSVHHGEGATWHDSACEIMACDFRIVVCGTEAEFWPHPGIPRPEEVPAVRQWWVGATGQLADGLAAKQAA